MIKLVKESFYNESITKAKLLEFISSAEVLSMGPQCKSFEEGFSAKQNRAHSVYVNSGSSANLVLLQAMLNLGRLKPGSKVGVSAVTWATNVMPLIQLGMIPQVIDCDLASLNITSEELRRHIQDLDALFITNSLGFCDDIKAIAQLCQEYNVILLEDNCESLGSRAYGKLLGNFGLASTFSFFVGHHLSTIEGGMICTDDQELNDMLVATRAHGWDRNLSAESQAKLRGNNEIDPFFAKYTFYDLGYNCRPTEINGVLGNEQLQYLDEIAQKRDENFQHFQSLIKLNPSFLPLDLSHMDLVSNFAMPVICRDQETFHSYRAKFEASDVEVRPIIAGNIARQPFFKKYVKATVSCPQADIIHRQGFYFPNHPGLTTDEIDTLSNHLH